MYLGGFESRNELALRNLAVAVGVDQLENVVSLGLRELDVELLEDEFQEVVGFLAVEESAVVLVEGAPDVDDYLSDVG